MKAQDIEKIIARHILHEGSLDEFLATPDRSEETQNFLDMLVQEKHRRIMNDLNPLATAEPSEILKAFQTFGAYETTFYIQRLLAGSHELADIRALYMAARKMGYPEESWDQVCAHTQNVGSLALKNPQSEIYQGHKRRMDEAAKAVLCGTQRPEDLPYIDDRMYLNSILTGHASTGPEYEEQAIAAERLIGYVLDQSDQYPDMTIEQELRYAGLLALASMNLPGTDRYSHDVTKKPLHDQLAVAHEKCTALMTDLDLSLVEHAGNSKHVDYLEKWRLRITGAADIFSGLTDRVSKKQADGIELFIQPVQLAIRVYNHDLARKVATILRAEIPEIAHQTISRRFRGPTPL